MSSVPCPSLRGIALTRCLTISFTRSTALRSCLWTSSAVLADFPWVAAADDLETQDRLRRWALGLAAVSTGQLDAPGVNGPVTLGSGQISAVRPPRYGRAAIVDSAAAGGFVDVPPTQRRLCDIKGCGVAPGVRLCRPCMPLG